MMIVVAIPSAGDGGKPDLALHGLQEYKQFAFPRDDGKFAITPISFVYITTPHNNQERIDEELARHVAFRKDGIPGQWCGYCADNPRFPCATVRTLTGVQGE